MSLTMAICMLALMWTSVALAMLWGVLRILRRHSPAPPPLKPSPPRRPTLER
ncbi:hypothetical protein SJI00_14165 [Pseudomonas sp. RP23018S]|uniref:hypothetical protein n=1 Tax=Pseudomonas sp. RP23018S TaxID=3096037 RepID=UPI002ACAB70C|nr:hypothetical protein [Pseudomonas sp. RP23018S]MDZ5603919.1 hypothetical protein [Pseudomonas sp. RP23018S]